MSKHDSSLSKGQFDLLNAFKKQLTATSAKNSAVEKQAAPQADTSAAPEDSAELFRQSVQGVKKMAATSCVKRQPVFLDCSLDCRDESHAGFFGFNANIIHPAIFSKWMRIFDHASDLGNILFREQYP